MTACTKCFGCKSLDEYGHPGFRHGFLVPTALECDRCSGTGEEPASALYSYATERTAELELDRLEAIAR